jgi:hypothetical protein
MCTPQLTNTAMHKKISLTGAFIILAICQVLAQDFLERKVQLESSTFTIEDVLTLIGSKGGFSFMYNNSIERAKSITLNGGTKSVREWLDLIFDHRVKYVVSKDKIILQVIKRSGSSAADEMTIHGYVYDSLSHEVLNGASLLIEELSAGIHSNAYGFFSITVPAGTYHLRVSYMGYVNAIEVITPDNTDARILLRPSYFQLQTVDVQAETNQHVASSEPGSIRLNAQTLTKIPALAGEVDVLRALQFFPGVKSSSEASSGISVRGGNLDQNMILLDEAPVYNPSHVIGALSVFNSDAIRDVTLYKGFIPAWYGGRLSSVLDVRMKDGNSNRTAVTGGVGTISSRLTIEGPYSKKRGSFLVSSRYTYADAFTRTLKFMRDNRFRFYFYDLNAKGNFNLNRNNKLFLSLYAGEDVNRLGILSDIKWKNATGTLRWNHAFNDKLFVNSTFLYSNYKYEIRAGHINPFSWLSGIRDLTFKSDFNFFPNSANTLVFGFSSTHHKVNPGQPAMDGKVQGTALSNLLALEHSLYLSNEQKVGQFTFQYGLRYSLFQNIGKATIYQYDDAYRVIDSTAHSTNDVYHTSGGLEPRLAVTYLVNSSASLKASYARTYQYLQLLSNSSFGLSPFDTWFPSGPNIKPQKADQVSLGYFRNLKDNLIEASIEVYHRWLYHQSDYANHAQLLFNPHLEGELRFGSGKAYGVELFVRKNTGRLTGWFGYNYSRAIKLIPEITRKHFNANYDQPHSISIVANYYLSSRVELSANWIYATGRPTTLPVETFGYTEYQVPVFGARNSTRLPDYHRLDASVILHSKVRTGKRSGHNWVLSVYNVYARKNPMMIFLSKPFGDFKSETGTDAYRISILPFFPSITYNFKF